MKSRVCPCKNYCRMAGNCEDCDHYKGYEGLANKIRKLKATNKALKEENEALKNRLDILLNPSF